MNNLLDIIPFISPSLSVDLDSLRQSIRTRIFQLLLKSCLCFSIGYKSINNISSVLDIQNKQSTDSSNSNNNFSNSNSNVVDEPPKLSSKRKRDGTISSKCQV